MSFDYVSGSVSLSVELRHHHFLSTQVQKPGTSPFKPFVFRNSSILYPSLSLFRTTLYSFILHHCSRQEATMYEQITLHMRTLIHNLSYTTPSPNSHTHPLPPPLSLISHAQQPSIQEPVHRHSPSSHHEPPPIP